MEVIPLSQNYSSVFTIDIDGETYTFVTSYNSRFGNWSFNIAKNEIEIITGVSMVLGTDIVGQFNLGIDVLFMADLEQTNLDASAFDLGTRVVLVHATQEEIENAIAV